MALITKLESDCAAMTNVLSGFCKHILSVQQDFNLLDAKLNDLKNDAKASRIEILGLLTKIKDVSTNAHTDTMRHLIKESIELEICKQDPIRYLAAVTPKLVEAEIYDLKSRFNTLKIKVDADLR